MISINRTAAHELRTKAASDLWFFNRHVMGFADIDTPLHHEMCATRQSWGKELFTLHLVPRGHLKTSILTIGHSCWEIVRNPNIRIGLFNAEYANGARMVRQITAQFLSNPVMRVLWPEYCVQPGRYRSMRSSHAFEVPNRTISGEATVTLVSVAGSAVSQHFDLMNYDDMLAEKHVNTQELRDSHWEWFLNSLQLRHDPASSRVVQEGTRWHYDDTYGRQIKQERDLRKMGGKQLRLYRRSAVENGSAIWPERFNAETLAKLRSQLGDYIFSCQYMNEPVPAAASALSWAAIREISHLDLPTPVAYYASVFFRTDLSEGKYDAIVLVAVDSRGQVYIHTAHVGTFTPTQLLEDLSYLNRAYHLDAAYLSSDIADSTMIPVVRRLDRKDYDSIPFVVVDRAKTSKVARILALQPLIRAGHFHRIEGLPNVDVLKDEFDQMSGQGSMGHDSLLTCLADFVQHAGRAHSIGASWYPPGSFGANFPWPPTKAERNRSPVLNALFR